MKTLFRRATEIAAKVMKSWSDKEMVNGCELNQMFAIHFPIDWLRYLVTLNFPLVGVGFEKRWMTWVCQMLNLSSTSFRHLVTKWLTFDEFQMRHKKTCCLLLRLESFNCTSTRSRPSSTQNKGWKRIHSTNSVFSYKQNLIL